jgi:hypothetical protein
LPTLDTSFSFSIITAICQYFFPFCYQIIFYLNIYCISNISSSVKSDGHMGFPLFGYYKWFCYEHLFKGFYVDTYLEMTLLDHMLTPCPFGNLSPKQLHPKAVAPFYTPVLQEAPMLHPHQLVCFSSPSRWMVSRFWFVFVNN